MTRKEITTRCCKPEAAPVLVIFVNQSDLSKCRCNKFVSREDAAFLVKIVCCEEMYISVCIPANIKLDYLVRRTRGLEAVKWRSCRSRLDTRETRVV